MPSLVQNPNTNEITTATIATKVRNHHAKGSANTESREHKKRQKARNRELKKQELDNLVAKIKHDAFSEQILRLDAGMKTKKIAELTEEISKLEISEEGNTHNPEGFQSYLSNLYPEIPDFVESMRPRISSNPDSENSTFTSKADFWAAVPAICQPDESVFDSNITPEKKYLIEHGVKQKKYEKKLKAKLKDKEITEEEYHELLAKHGRKLNNSENDYKETIEITEGSESQAAQGIRTFPQHICNCNDCNGDEEKGEISIINDSLSSDRKEKLLSADRGMRKNQQVENFAQLLSLHDDFMLMQQSKTKNDSDVDPTKNCTTATRSANSSSSTTEISTSENSNFHVKKSLKALRRVVDFGCGTGNLCL